MTRDGLIKVNETKQTTERVIEHLDAAHTRKASKKAVRKAQEESTAKTQSSRLQFTEEELSAPELEKYLKKSDYVKKFTNEYRIVILYFAYNSAIIMRKKGGVRYATN